MAELKDAAPPAEPVQRDLTTREVTILIAFNLAAYALVLLGA